jgi:hypothetical protein
MMAPQDQDPETIAGTSSQVQVETTLNIRQLSITLAVPIDHSIFKRTVVVENQKSEIRDQKGAGPCIVLISDF